MTMTKIGSKNYQGKFVIQMQTKFVEFMFKWVRIGDAEKELMLLKDSV